MLVVSIEGGAARPLCYDGCVPKWSPDGRSFYLALGRGSPSPTLILPVEPGHALPPFTSGAMDEATAWRARPGARVTERPESLPGLIESTYVFTRTDERRNLFRVPLSR